MTSPEFQQIPDDLSEAITFLEVELQSEIAAIDQNSPSETAPVGVQIAHALRANRLRADSEFINMLRENRDFLTSIPKET